MSFLLSVLTSFLMVNKFYSFYQKYKAYKMSLRINYVNRSGKRTSTTINSNIIDYYCYAVLKNCSYTDLEKVKIINDLVSQGEHIYCKDDIEEELLSKIYYTDPFES